MTSTNFSAASSPATRESLLKLSYSAKLRHPSWLERKLQVIHLADYCCQECLAPWDENGFEIHHIAYLANTLPWEYPLANLLCLCRSCHQKRQEFERELLIRFASVLHEKRIDELKTLPIWTFFEGLDMEGKDGR